jgi:hypothetical protein
MAAEDAAFVRRSLAQLSEDDRRLFELFFDQELGTAAIAERLGTTNEAVRSRLSTSSRQARSSDSRRRFAPPRTAFRPDTGATFVERIGDAADRADRVTPVVPQLVARATCVPNAQTLCLLDGRFEVKVTWRNRRNGQTGVGAAVPGTDQTGFFWFFDASNVDLVVKALDGVGLNGKYWFFYGALSDVEYTIYVTDTMTSLVRSYDNAARNICGAGDINAFAGSQRGDSEACGSLGRTAVGPTAAAPGPASTTAHRAP